MTYHTLIFPPALQTWVEARIAEGEYEDVEDYVRDLIRRDRDVATEDRRWLKALIDEGLGSGVVDMETEDVIDAIIAEDPDLRD